MRGIFYKFPAKSKQQQQHPAIAAKRRPRRPLLASSWLPLTLAATFLLIAKITVQLTNEEPPTAATLINALGQRPDRALPGAVPAIPAASPNFEAAFQGECGQNNSQSGNPCEHICLDLHDGTYECSCFYGFTLAVDGYSCARLPPAASSIVSSPKPEPQPPPPLQPPAPPGQNARSTGPPVARVQLAEPEQSQSLERRPPQQQQQQQQQQKQQTEPANGRANDKRKLPDESRGAGSGEDAQAAPPVKSSSTRLSATASPWSSWAVSGGGGNGSGGQEASEPPTWAQPQKQEAAPTTTTTTTPTLAEATKMSRQHERELRNKVDARTAAAAARWPVELESGGDKRMSYDVDVASSSAAPPSPPPPADEDNSRPPTHGTGTGEARNSALNLREDIDPDIRSIMMVNDRLVEQLAQSVSQLAGRRGQPAGFGPAAAADADHEGAARSRRRRAEDYDMKKLAQLVGKTMSDSGFEGGEVGRGGEANEDGESEDNDQDDNRAPTPLAAFHWPRINEPAGAANQSYRWRTDERASGRGGDGGGDAGTEARQRRPHNSHRVNINNRRRHREPSNGRNNCHHKPEKLYANCNDMPECESGGRCALEPISDGGGGSASQDHHHHDNDKLTTIGGGLTWAARCRCPIGRGGSLCQRPIQREVPRFLGHSYLALPMSRGAPALTSLRLLFRPEPAESLGEPRRGRGRAEPQPRARPPSPDLVAAAAAAVPEQAAGSMMVLLLHSSKFALLLDGSMSRIELHYLSEQNDDGTSKITRVMGSRDVRPNEWNELIVIDATTTTTSPVGSNGDGGLREPSMVTSGVLALDARHSKVNNDIDSGRASNKIILVTPDRIELAAPAINSSELFVAGLPALAAGQPVEDKLGVAQAARGFRGCIRELEINARRYNLRSDLNGDTLDGFDVVECCNLSSPESSSSFWSS